MYVSTWLASTMLQMLTCHHESLLILEESEQAFGTCMCPTTMAHFHTTNALGSMVSSC